MESKYSRFLTVLLIVIIVGVIGLLGYLAYNYFRDNSIEQEASEFVQTFTNTSGEDFIISNSTIDKDNVTEGEDNATVGEDIEVNDIQVESGSSNKKKTYKGFNVLGTIEIPKTNVKYPVLEKPTRKALEVAVAVLYPRDAVLNSQGNVVIIGHNYRNSKFFSNNKKLSNGDKIYITGLDGKKITYIIYKTFQTDENDTSFYNRDTNGAREITLSTCTDDSSARTIILAKAQGD